MPGNHTFREKIEASIVVVGYQKEDHRMYPHLSDFLLDLRCAYAEVVYLDDDDRGDGLYSFDRFLHNIVSVRGARALVGKLRQNARSLFGRSTVCANAGRPRTEALSAPPPSFGAIAKDTWTMFGKLAMHFVKRRRLIARLKSLDLGYERRLLIAIDHTAVAVATRYFTGKVILWSFDIPTRDYDSNHHMRIKNGFYEKAITAKGALDTDILMIQDEKRKSLLEEALDVEFGKIIYLPVSLNDSPFCAESARARQAKNSFVEIGLIQSGGIGKSRLSDQLIEAYRVWPAHYHLTLHGVVFSHDMIELIDRASRKPHLSREMLDHQQFPSFLGKYDIGFVGYAEKNRNHDFIENASAQLVAFLRQGIPVIACGSSAFNEFVSTSGIGLGVSSIDEVEAGIATIVGRYAEYSSNARKMFEVRFDLSRIFREQLLPRFDAEMMAAALPGGREAVKPC